MLIKYLLFGLSFTALLMWLFFAHYGTTPTYLYKVVSVDNWEKSKGEDRLSLSSMDDRFIHLATEKQLDRIIKKFWKDEECVVLKVAVNQLPGNLVFESNPGGVHQYYHLYDGFIPTSSVISTVKGLQ